MMDNSFPLALLGHPRSSLTNFLSGLSFSRQRILDVFLMFDRRPIGREAGRMGSALTLSAAEGQEGSVWIVRANSSQALE
jgi:hypothetical protein